MLLTGQFPHTRHRRLRHSKAIRSLVQETRLHTQRLMAPLFIKEGQGIRKPIASMKGQYQYSVDQLPEVIAELVALGIEHVLLFGIPTHKDTVGESACRRDGVVQEAIRAIKAQTNALSITVDLCFCEYTDHGHCGPLTRNKNDVDNDATCDMLGKQAVSLAKAGADVIAPSGSIDGMVQAIRKALDAEGLLHIPILSYSVKYASSFYGPFREAAEGAPKFGDRRTYQMDFARRSTEALHECALDIAEGADMLMVKPAHTYLDVIHHVKQQFPHMPLGAYHTSGEFAMLKAASAEGLINEKAAVLETMTAIFRAGADFVITYYARELAEWLKD